MCVEPWQVRTAQRSRRFDQRGINECFPAVSGRADSL